MISNLGRPNSLSLTGRRPRRRDILMLTPPAVLQVCVTSETSARPTATVIGGRKGIRPYNPSQTNIMDNC